MPKEEEEDEEEEEEQGEREIHSFVGFFCFLVVVVLSRRWCALITAIRLLVTARGLVRAIQHKYIRFNYICCRLFVVGRRLINIKSAVV